MHRSGGAVLRHGVWRRPSGGRHVEAVARGQLPTDLGDVRETAQPGGLIEAEPDREIRDGQQRELLWPGERCTGSGHAPMMTKGCDMVPGRCVRIASSGSHRPTRVGEPGDSVENVAIGWKPHLTPTRTIPQMRRHVGVLVVAALAALAAPVAHLVLGPPATASADGCSAPAPSGAPTPPLDTGFHAMVPVRLLDTRTSAEIGAGCTAVLDLAGTTAIPADAQAVALNITVTDAPGRGLVTAYPCGSPRPDASNLNPRPLQPTANSAVVQIDSTRTICLYSYTQLNLIVDATGWFARFGDPYHSVTNRRLLDTRTTSLRPDGGRGALRAGSELRLPIVGASAPSGATAVSINVTTTDALGPGFVTAYPCGGGRPDTSTVNYLAGEQRAGHTIIGVGNGGAVCLWAYSTVHVVVDLEGWFGTAQGDPGTLLRPIVGSRVLDTRVGIGGVTGKVAADTTISFDPADNARLPIGSTVVLDVVSTEADGPGFLTLYPCGQTRPITSTVNALVGNEGTNLAMVTVDASSRICVYSYSSMHVVIDVLGSFGPGGPVHDLSVDQLPFEGQQFSPDRHDLAVRCATGANPMTVRATAAPGATVSIAPATQPAPMPVTGTAVASLTLAENDAFVVRAAGPGQPPQEYWVRCLPHDFPPIRMVRSDVARPGWYLTEDFYPSLGTSPYGYFVMILDERGVPVWYRRVARSSVNLSRLTNGTLAWTALQGQGFGDGSNPGGAVEVHSLDGTLLREIRPVDSFTDHHDVLELPNGNFVLVTYVQRTGVDLSVLGKGTSETVWDGHLQEIDPAGNKVWEWKSEDHIAVSETKHLVTFPGVTGYDLIHINSVSLAPDGDLLVSGRHTDAVYKIRHDATGDIVWRVGGSRSDVTFPNDPGNGFDGQHDAQLLADGHLRVFDNRTFLGAPPRAVEYALDIPGGTATLVSQRSEAGVDVSFGVGSARSLDGDEVITWGGSTNPVFTEVDGQGREIQRLTMGVAFPYRVKKLALADFDIGELRATSGRG